PLLPYGNLSPAPALWQPRGERRVLIRDIGIAGHARVNAGTEEETDAFLHAIDEILAESPDTLAAGPAAAATDQGARTAVPTDLLTRDDPTPSPTSTKGTP